MSVHSGSPSPLQMAANGQPDEAKMPQGHCRYILLHPEVKGRRCACANFSLNTGIPGATCECGHLACFHNKEPEVSTDQKQELELLKRRLQQLEEQMSKGQDDVLDSVISRLNEVEDHLEKSKEEVGEQIKGAYRNVSMSWRSIEQAERRTQQHDEQLRQIYDKLRDHDEQLDRVHAGQLELRDADLSLEERIENLTETLEEEEELRLSAALARCLSRGLHQMVAVQGRDAASFKQAVEKAFGRFLRGREWMPLQAKLCDAATLQGLPMLRQLDDPGRHALLIGGAPGCDHEFLRRHCAVLDPHGVIDSLYIAMRRHTISWHTLRHAPVFMEGLESCWAHDALLDTDPFDDADMAVDDEDRPAAGDLTTALPPVTAAVGAVAGLKRPLTEMSRSNSFSSGTAAGAAAAVASGGGGGGEVGDEARVKRACPASSVVVTATAVAAGQPGGPIVDLRRRDTIKTA
ncbi:hypothetical protein CHGG_02613 [Chaetomium globosum CBS 148.51]|uniref:Uncharacterized protein n=1 Tax=Chaetomium globosum (strain ATCC 6205 / CBS 148.51 / DSM 1962 / NBRC 6347 / NRRL 1970) TaxID=306901 RepID=Q2HAZ1_CHAGB|nr:uncharacterized protein CHGG_02613 [Chaetomium globosum CBS 148.51]EAQ90678.1 hypothetical protein CHGG_02613 [Chaetomium globosum CBS 148.51]